jgi:hypothetical protein
MEGPDFDVDFFKLHVELSFLESQLQWVLCSHYIRVSFDVSGLFMVASSPCLLFLEAGQQERLLALLRERFDGMRSHVKPSLFLQQPRTVSGWDLAALLREEGITVSFFLSFLPSPSPHPAPLNILVVNFTFILFPLYVSLWLLQVMP